jgi:hypothetical protein
MKRKKTRLENVELLKQVQERLRQEPPGIGGYAAAEAAQAAWNEAKNAWQNSPLNSQAHLVGLGIRERYWASISRAYPGSFSRSQDQLRAGDSAGMEDAVGFLEADPIFDGTGWRKEYLIRLIRDVEVTADYALRLRAIILSIVDRRDGQEFRAYCRLANKADTPELRNQLSQRLLHNAPAVRRRAQWVLEALAQKDSMEKRI